MPAHSRIDLHFVWSTKYRQPTISELIQDGLYRAIAKKAIELGAFVHALDRTDDHVHLVVRIAPTVTPSEFIGQVKGYSSHSANLLATAAPMPRFAWQAEYSVTSISESMLPIVIRYVENQRRHHAGGTLHPELELPPVESANRRDDVMVANATSTGASSSGRLSTEVSSNGGASAGASSEGALSSGASSVGASTSGASSSSGAQAPR